MDSNGKAMKTTCGTVDIINMAAENNRNPNEVVVIIPAGVEEDFKIQKSNIPVDDDDAPQISKSKPPKNPTNETLTRRKSIARSVYSNPKSRFGEQSLPMDANFFDELAAEHTPTSPYRNVSSHASPSEKMGSSGNSLIETMRKESISTPKTPWMASPGGGPGGVDEQEEIYKKVKIRNTKKYKRVKVKVLVEWLMFLLLLGCLTATLLVDKLKNFKIWDLGIWKWIVLVMVTFSGMLITKWCIHFIVLLIELNFLLRKKVLYFVFGLKKSVQVCVWLSLVLVTWVLLFANGVKRSRIVNKIINYITWTIASMLIGSFLWLLKTLMLKILAASFHVNTFFDRIQQSIFDQYILLTLSGPPVMESAHMFGRSNSVGSQLSLHRTKKGKDGKEKKEKEMIDINKLHQMKREKVSAWTMKMLVDVISNSGLSTISGSIGESDYGDNEQADKEINNEEEAIAAAVHIFKNVAQPHSKYIDEYDLQRFMIKEEVEVVLSLIDAAETGLIDRKALTEWVVKVYQGRKALSHALNDTKTAVRQLNKIVTGILIVLIIIIWLLLVGIATTRVIFFMSSQLVVASFLFGNTCKTIFEGIVFVFVMHPFDVGDRCVVDGVQLIVEEMNIMTTVFLKYDNEKIFYPNSVLATKPISNFYRSPDMSDSFEFSIDFRTPLEKIGALKEKIKLYLERNFQYWHANHSVVVKEIENMNKIKMALYFNHTINFQNFGEKSRRRSEVILEMKKIFEELHITYDLLPQQVHLLERNGPSSLATNTT